MANTRREFLSAVSTAAALSALPTQVGASVTPAKLPSANCAPAMGIALVGLGAQSLRNVGTLLANPLLANPLLANHLVCRISALVSGDASKAQAYAKAWSIDRSHVYDYDSFDRIVADEAIDIVYLAVPTGMHCELAVRAAKAGKHVFCESPMAVSYTHLTLPTT
jgi:glucose-fructose oxidoreductase